MKKVAHYFFLPALCLYLALPMSAQEEAVEAAEIQAPPKKWEIGAGVGGDLSQLMIINPRQGAGQNRIGFGGALNVFAKYKKERITWENIALLQFGVQKLGAGPLPTGKSVPFQKALDETRLNSTFGFKTSESSKFSYATNASFFSQFTPTYLGPPSYPGNFLSDVTGTGIPPVSQFFSPAFITLSVGIDYKPNDNFSVFYSPVGGKLVVVADDDIAVLGVHGNRVTRDTDGNVVSFSNTDPQFGSLLRSAYSNKFFNDRLILNSGLILFSNYIRNPQNIDVDWTNEIGLIIFKGLQLAALVNLFYDDDVLVQITDYSQPNGVSGLGKRVSITQQLLLKYTATF
jgi:hypothetical protein